LGLSFSDMTNLDAFALEFNEAQQCFHHNHGLESTTPWGWVIVYEKCTELEDLALEAYLALNHPGRRTAAQVLEAAKEVRQLLKMLDREGIELKFKNV
jgi:hypothetical protein